MTMMIQEKHTFYGLNSSPVSNSYVSRITAYVATTFSSIKYGSTGKYDFQICMLPKHALRYSHFT